MKTHKIAAIDIGSNSLKLSVVEAAASDSFTVIQQDRERVRLGQETLRNKFLSSEAINRSAQSIAKFRSIAESRNADAIVAVATASVREAENGNEFVREIEEKTGVHIDILSSIEEARLIGVAVAQYFDAENKTLINVDIGGGSTELSLMKNGEPDKLFSMKLGAVGLTEKHIFSDTPREQEIKNLQAEINAALIHPLKKLKNARWDFATGTSGTILNLAAMLDFQMSENADEKSEISLKRLSALNKILAKISLEERAKFPAISAQRAEVIVAGGQILEGVMRALPVEMLEPCAYALREGVIIDFLRKIESESLPPVPGVEDKKLRDVFVIGRRYGYEEEHALKTADLAEKIFDALAPVYGLKRHDRTLLSAAALLHDVGYHISHEDHHKHSFYLIKHSEMTGFTETEKLIVANVARYHRGSLPKEKHEDFARFGEKDQQTIARLGGILRVADALDCTYESRVRDVKFKREKNDWFLKIVGCDNCSVELEAVEQKKDLFEAAFDCNLIAL